MTTTTQAATIDGLLAKLHANYVFPDVAARIEEDIRRRAAAGEFDGLGSDDLARALTAAMQGVSRDKHLRLFYREEAIPEREKDWDDAAWRQGYERAGRAENFGVERVERLPGNVGYLDLREFHDPAYGGETATAAMTLLANTDALIVDIRRNGGGDPSMVALVTSYLFDPEPVHLNDLYWRSDDSTQQFWTYAHVPGRRFGKQKPVWVLTGRHTFSGAEEFAHNLKHLKRATLVGQPTGGGAHPGDVYRIDAHFEAFIPTGRAINPISGGNWEGAGVAPDVEVPEEDALETAQVLALRHVLEHADGATTRQIEEARVALAKLDG